MFQRLDEMAKAAPGSSLRTGVGDIGDFVGQLKPFGQPEQLTVERDRRSIEHRTRMETRDDASQQLTAHPEPVSGAFEMQLHGPTRKQAMRGFDKRTIGRDVDDVYLVAWSKMSRLNPVFLHEMTPSGVAPVGPDGADRNVASTSSRGRHHRPPKSKERATPASRRFPQVSGVTG